MLKIIGGVMAIIGALLFLFDVVYGMLIMDLGWALLPRMFAWAVVAAVGFVLTKSGSSSSSKSTE